MPISFSCTCGKRLKAREEFSGRKIKCPGCQKVLAIPEPVMADTPPAQPPPPVLAEASPAVPLARPVEVKTGPPASPPFSRASAEPVTVHRTAVTPYNPWMDRSLEQTSTPWLGDDRERFNRGMEFREGPSLWPILAALLVVGAAAAVFLVVA